MKVTIEMPRGVDPIQYLTSFAPAFSENVEMQSALLGVQDSLRQADKIPHEPLGMMAYLTAEEEAATFFFHALRAKGYSVSNSNKLRDHKEKVKFFVLAMALQEYFFGRRFGSVRVERIGDRPATSLQYSVSGYDFVEDDPLGAIVTKGEGEEGRDASVEEAIDDVLRKITPKGFTAKSHVDKLANRRNLCLYGAPEKKPKLQTPKEIEPIRFNCIGIIVLGFLVLNGEEGAASMVKLTNCFFQKIKGN